MFCGACRFGIKQRLIELHFSHFLRKLANAFCSIFLFQTTETPSPEFLAVKQAVSARSSKSLKVVLLSFTAMPKLILALSFFPLWSKLIDLKFSAWILKSSKFSSLIKMINSSPLGLKALAASLAINKFGLFFLFQTEPYRQLRACVYR
jgi:hypothetical protein